MHEALEADLVQKGANKGKTFHIVLIAPIRTAPSHCKTQLIFSLGCFQIRCMIFINQGAKLVSPRYVVSNPIHEI